jgi:hypothetical protein
MSKCHPSFGCILRAIRSGLPSLSPTSNQGLAALLGSFGGRQIKSAKTLCLAAGLNLMKPMFILIAMVGIYIWIGRKQEAILSVPRKASRGIEATGE